MIIGEPVYVVGMLNTNTVLGRAQYTSWWLYRSAIARDVKMAKLLELSGNVLIPAFNVCEGVICEHELRPDAKQHIDSMTEFQYRGRGCPLHAKSSCRHAITSMDTGLSAQTSV